MWLNEDKSWSKPTEPQEWKAEKGNVVWAKQSLQARWLTPQSEIKCLPFKNRHHFWLLFGYLAPIFYIIFKFHIEIMALGYQSGWLESIDLRKPTLALLASFRVPPRSCGYLSLILWSSEGNCLVPLLAGSPFYLGSVHPLYWCWCSKQETTSLLLMTYHRALKLSWNFEKHSLSPPSGLVGVPPGFCGTPMCWSFFFSFLSLPCSF